MFCPQCRHHWQLEDLPHFSLTGGGRSTVCCPTFHATLAPDRLAAEFPPMEHASTVSSPLTVQDVLRETATGSNSNAPVPLDEQIKRFRKSFWEHEPEPAPGVLPTFRRIGNRWAPQIDMALGFGTLAAVILVVAGVFI